MPRIWTFIFLLLAVGLAVSYFQREQERAPDTMPSASVRDSVMPCNEQCQRVRHKATQTVLRQTSPQKSACPQKRAAAFVGEAQRVGVIHRIDTGRSVPHIYVRPAWYELTIDDKKIFDAALQCWLSADGRSRVIAVYHDYRTGKEVADSNQHGFSMQ